MADPIPTGVSNPDDLARLLDEQMRAGASALIQRFCRSQSFVTQDLLTEAWARIVQAKGGDLHWSRDEDARAYAYTTMLSILIDRERRRREVSLPEGHDPSRPGTNVALLLDMLDALVALDRAVDERLRDCMRAFKAYHFMKHQARFSKEGPAMVGFEYHDKVRTFQEVAKLCGIKRSEAESRVKEANRWLERRLRDYGHTLPKAKQ